MSKKKKKNPTKMNTYWEHVVFLLMEIVRKSGNGIGNIKTFKESKLNLWD